jgi:hypothetical protein
VVAWGCLKVAEVLFNFELILIDVIRAAAVDRSIVFSNISTRVAIRLEKPLLRSGLVRPCVSPGRGGKLVFPLPLLLGQVVDLKVCEP